MIGSGANQQIDPLDSLHGDEIRTLEQFPPDAIVFHLHLTGKWIQANEVTEYPCGGCTARGSHTKPTLRPRGRITITSMDHMHCSQQNIGAVTIIFGTVHGAPALYHRSFAKTCQLHLCTIWMAQCSPYSTTAI